MEKFDKSFLLGAATAAHQVEGNNINSDFWVMEHLEHSDFAEPSNDAVDHYNRYEEDIKLMAKAGLGSYRFSIEWARIEPEQGKYSKDEIEHYSKVLKCCHENGITPIVTMHHFSSPKWLITEGGWESEKTIESFKNYCGYVVEQLGNQMEYICTINEANMGLQIATIARDFMKQMGIELQVGMNFPMPEEKKLTIADAVEAFGLTEMNQPNVFLSLRTEAGDRIIMQAHEAARDAMKEICPHLKVGVTLSLYDIWVLPGGESGAKEEWEMEFGRYIPYIRKDDFIGVQNYTRKIIGETGSNPAPKDSELTEMGYEFYPESIGNVIRKVAKELPLPIIVTENGLATQDDSRRVEFIKRALESIQECIDDGIPVKGYMYWSLLDNFEWQKGFSKHFGLIAVDRTTQTRLPKQSLSVLGSYCSKSLQI